MLRQEASDGFIVELQAEPRQQDASNDDGRALGWKESLFFTHAEYRLDERVMHPVQGVGDSIQEPTYFIRSV